MATLVVTAAVSPWAHGQQAPAEILKASYARLHETTYRLKRYPPEAANHPHISDVVPPGLARAPLSFIDWSDSEALFGLLLDYVADEHSEAREATRRVFLSRLTKQLEALQGTFDVSPPDEVIDSLRAMHRSIPGEFQRDPVVEHLGACVEELERIHATHVAEAP